jgi:hypothetical protein
MLGKRDKEAKQCCARAALGHTVSISFRCFDVSMMLYRCHCLFLLRVGLGNCVSVSEEFMNPP